MDQQRMVTFKWSKSVSEPKFPVEFDRDDQNILGHVIDRKLSMGGRERLIATLMACHHVARNGIEGAFAECGVWRGGHGLIAANVFSRLAKPAKIYLFDTFAGMTAPTEHDVEIATGVAASGRYQRGWRATHNAWCYASVEEVRRNFNEAGLLSDDLKLIEGDVVETLMQEDHLPRQISVLRLDTDWYESTKRELEILWPRLQRGGILIVDDYGHWAGARKAVDEFFAGSDRPFFHCIDYTGRLAVKT